MTVVTRSLLEQLPKAELHCHLDGSVRPDTLLELGREYHVAMPRDDAEALREYMLVRDASSLEEYLTRFATTLSVMQTHEAIERIAHELAVDASREGVWYLETRFAPLLNTRGGLTPAQALEAAISGLAKAERETGIVARVIVCALRTLAPASSIEMARLAVDFHAHGVVGFDLAGAESLNPPSAHAEAFTYARSHGVACTCHAGEGDGAGSVADAVHSCCVSRIGHGTRLIEDPALTEYVNDRRIALEVCLTSNVQTRAARSLEEHPLPAYLQRGLNVVLNTDNRLMSGTTLTDEYQLASERLGLGLDDLVRMALNGFESAFLPWNDRQALVARAVAAIGALRTRGAA
ncbi:MAG TPA: adenosine deaminase [Gemmatimonadaceae bacterium]